MKNVGKILIFTIIMVLIGSLLSVASAEDPINVKFQFDKTAYEEGEEITVKYTITGGSGDYPTTSYICYSIDNGDSIAVTDGTISGAKGTIKFTPTIGQKAFVSLTGFDSEGRYFSVDSDKVAIAGGESGNPIEAEFTFNKSTYDLGDEITVKYNLTGGSGLFSSIYYTCCSSDNGDVVIVTNGETSKAKGTLKFTPTLGQEAYVSLSGFDSDGRYFNLNSEKVTIVGGETGDKIKAKFTFDKTTYNLGETITVKYKLTGGSGDYETVYYTCFTNDKGDLLIIHNGESSGAKGTIKFTPTIGQEAFVSLNGFDSDGRYFSMDSENVSLAGRQLVDISMAEVTVKEQTYTGKSIEPDLTVKMDRKKLKLDTDYTVKWKNNKKVGIATVTLTGTGKYTGTTEANFVIKPGKVTLSSVKEGSKKLTVKWKKSSGVDGYELEYSLKKNFKNAETVKISNAKTTSAKLEDLKKKKTYYVRIRAYKEIGGKKYYSEWSETKKAKTK